MPRKPSRQVQSPKPPRNERTGPGERLRKVIFRPVPLILLALLATGSFFWPRIERWSRQLESYPEYQIQVRDVRVTAPNQWVPVDLVSQVLSRNDLPESVSPLDETLLPRIAASFASHPWVARVIAVRASRACGLEVDLEYRRPVAMVQTGRGLYPVDVTGTLLPPADFSASDAARLPLVRNVKTLPQGPAGTDWGDPAVLAAARLADVLAPAGDLFVYWDRYSLEAIVAPDRDTAAPELADLDFELVTRGGSRIVWGQAPGADDLEPTVSQKLARLDEYLATYGSFERPRGPIRIDIREYEVISLEDLAEGEYW